ncbi:MAG: hypothetical protein ABR915_23255 [Thermoguttaceae bacterium]
MTRSPRSEDDGRPSEIAGFDDQMWPINCAIVVLAGFVAGIVLANSDFHDGRLLYDGRLHLGIVGGLVVLTLVVARLLQGKIRRRLQLCILLSLLVHLSGAYCVYCNPVTLSIVADRGGDRRDLPPDEDFVAPDYHWVQAEEPDADQAFESPVETVVRDEMPPAATVAPPGPEQAMPVADIPRAPGVGETPLGSFGPGSQVAMPMAPVVASRQLQPVAGPAMNRQAVRAVEIPSPEGEVAELPAAAPKESPRGPEAATLAAVRTAPSTGVASQVAGLARSSAAARPLAEPSQAVPANSPLLQLGARVFPRLFCPVIASLPWPLPRRATRRAAASRLPPAPRWKGPSSLAHLPAPRSRPPVHRTSESAPGCWWPARESPAATGPAGRPSPALGVKRRGRCGPGRLAPSATAARRCGLPPRAAGGHPSPAAAVPRWPPAWQPPSREPTPPAARSCPPPSCRRRK